MDPVVMMTAFIDLVGERAIRETRTVLVLEDAVVPQGNYAFIEFYCTDPQCDCRRVVFQVWREDTKHKIWATITYGWAPPEYYETRLRCSPAEAKIMASAELEPISPQTEMSDALLELFKKNLLTDPDYVARLKRHYQEARPGREAGDLPSAVPVRRWKVRKRAK